MSESSQGVTLKRLPSSTVKLISSAQVITSVSSVVKELIENSLDAGASFLEIHLDGHGLDRIEVKDNGKGIPKSDVEFMCQRSYTSKISDFSDLDNLSSYGFRGEALFSICAIADVVVTTISNGDSYARSYKMNHNGEVVESKPANLDRGTSIAVMNLFKNLPVRKQFSSSTKRKAEEMKRVETIVKTLAIVNCSVKMKLTHNKFTLWQKASVSSIMRAFIQVLAPAIVKQLKEITFKDETEQIEITLLVPKIDCNIVTTCLGHTMEAIYLFVNQRPVREKQIEKAIQDKVFEFFGSKIPAKKYPAMLASIVLPPDLIDVNLEPNKSKVLVKDIEKVTKLLDDQLSLYYYGKADVDITEGTCEVEPLKRKILAVPISQPVKKPKKDLEDSSSCIRDTLDREEILVENAMVETSADEQFPRSTGLMTNPNLHSADAGDASSFQGTACKAASMLDSVPQMQQSALSSTENSQALDGLQNANTNYSNFEPTETSSFPAVTPAVPPKSQIVSMFLEGISSRPPPSPGPVPEPSQNPAEEHSQLIVAADPFDLLRKSDNTDKIDDFSEFFSNNCWSDDPWVDKSPEKPAIQSVPEKTTLIRTINEKSNIPNENLTDFSLSSWSRGDVLIDGKRLEGTTEVVGGSMIDDSPASPQSGDRSVSSQMGQKGMSAFTKFARQMRVEIVKADPGMSFPKIARELSKRWQELQEEDKKTYEEMAAADRLEKKNRVVVAKDVKPLGMKNEKFKPLFVKKYHTMEKISVKLCDIKQQIKNRNVKESIGGLPVIIGDLNDDVTLVKEKTSVYAASVARLNEAVKFFNNLCNTSLSLRVLEKGIEIDKQDLGSLWDVLEMLDYGVDANFQANQPLLRVAILDERILKNGFRIERIENSLCNKYVITDVAKDIANYGINNLREILQHISENNHCRLVDCRPVSVVNFIRNETVRSTSSQTFVRTDYTIDLYTFWRKKTRSRDDMCPHQRPVVQRVFPPS